MSRDALITGLDVGSTSIRLVVGQVVASKQRDEEQQLQIIGAIDVPTEGIHRGSVTSIDDAVESLSSARDKAERLVGMPIDHVFVGISGPYIIAQPSKGVIAVSRADGEIQEEDIERVIEAAQAVATPPNYEILHVIPRSFTVDHQTGVKDPLGMTGVRLEVDAQIILGLSSHLKNITKAVYRTGVDIDDLVLSTFAAAESVLTKRQKELGVALVNIGGGTTSVAVFEEGDVLHVGTIPIGSGHITSDIAIGLRTSIEVAEELKREYGSATPEKIAKKDDITLEAFGEGEGNVVSRKHLAEIIQARLEELFDRIDKELKKVDRSGLLPAGVVLTGGGSKLQGIVDAAKQSLRLPATLGYPQEVTSALEKIHDPAFAVSLGLVLWGYALSKDRPKTFLPRFSAVSQVTKRMKDLFKSLFS
ncbi:cell division protein FtsA [Candidatus Uhrbacteria bacterium]|nr:cell division protein FtsA [Candidatus Uhrbacteria bacterium]